MKIVIVAVDTLRADHLGCCGYHRETSPHTDALAAEGFVFTDCFAIGNCTHPGFTAMLTGCYPETTGIVSHWTPVDPPDEIATLAEIAKANGLHTLAVDNLCDRWQQHHRLYPWFRRAYDAYEFPENAQAHTTGNCDRACELIREHASEDFLLFYHPWHPHSPYEPPADCLRFEWDHDDALADVVAQYDGEIVFTDREIGRIVEALGSAGIYDQTLLLVTSDHGEIMGEDRCVLGHRFNTSHIDLGDECLKVPLILRLPGAVPAGRSDALAQQPDILPTVADLAGWPLPHPVDGVSLVSVMRGEAAGVRESVHFMENTYQRQRGIRTRTHKLKRNFERGDSIIRRELYDLEADPLEQFNSVDVEPDLAADLETRMRGWVAERLAAAGRSEDPLMAQGITNDTLRKGGRFASELQLAHAYVWKARQKRA